MVIMERGAIKKSFVLFTAFVLLMIGAVSVFWNGNGAVSAQEANREVLTVDRSSVGVYGKNATQTVTTYIKDGGVGSNLTIEAEPYSLFFSIDINLTANRDGTVSATATVTSRPFTKTIWVWVNLYRADSNVNFESNKVCVGREFQSEMKKGEPFTVTASTEGKASYWQAVLEWNENNQGWETLATKSAPVDANGNAIK